MYEYFRYHEIFRLLPSTVLCTNYLYKSHCGSSSIPRSMNNVNRPIICTKTKGITCAKSPRIDWSTKLKKSGVVFVCSDVLKIS